MRKRIVFVMICVLMTLTGCSGSKEDNELDIEQQDKIADFKENIYPDDFYFDEAYALGVGSSKKEVSIEYLALQETYRKILSDYFNEVLPLEELNHKLEGYGIAPADEPDYYQQQSLLDSDFIYLRNNIHLEKLSKEDAKLLIKYHKSKDADLKSEVEDMIKKTFVKVGTVDLRLRDGDKYYTTYTQGGSVQFWNYSIVFFINYEKPDAYIGSEQEQIEKRKTVFTGVNDLTEEYTQLFKEILDVDTEIHSLR